ncbi:MAG: TIGR02679 family protein [Actinomycetota bacterium]|nr:TIGR02679 family protein [Actinomycetota bacterium]
MTVLDRPGLGRLWDVVAERLQRNGLRPAGTLRLAALDRDERHALAGLLGRPVAHDRVTLDLADLDRRLRDSGAAAGLVEAADRLRGPLVDRPGRRQAHVQAAARVWAAGRRALEEIGLGAAPWVEAWFDELRRAGTLGRVPAERAERVLCTAVRCLSVLPYLSGDRPCGRGELASLVTGDAHGLDDGRLLSAVVLRAAAAMSGVASPSTPGGRRALWRAVGVLTDEVSTTVLTAGLRSAGRCWLDERTEAGWESHLSARDLRRIELCPPPDGVVFVCENPRVLEAAIDAGSRRAVVCTQGQPAVVVTALLEHLGAAGADLRYHGDFDWPGITIANLLVGTFRCRPWRFGAADYLDALARLAPLVAELPVLGGAVVDSCWEVQLTEEMAGAGRAVHEELVLDELLVDLRTPAGRDDSP